MGIIGWERVQKTFLAFLVLVAVVVVVAGVYTFITVR